MHLFVSQLSISRYSNSGIGTGSELKKKKKCGLYIPTKYCQYSVDQVL